MNDDRKREFHAILGWAASLPRPKLDYSQPPHSAFLSIQFYHRLLTIQASYMILWRSFAARLLDGLPPEPVARRGGPSLKEIVEWRTDLNVKSLFRAYCAYPHEGLISLMADLQMEEVFIETEVARRLEGKPVSCEFIRLDWLEENRTKQVKRLLKVDKIKAKRPWEQDAADIQQSALLKALDVWRKTGEVQEEIFPLPDFPFPLEDMLPDERAFWEGPMARAWEIGKQIVLNEIVPILTGEKESIPQKVRDHRRNEWDTRVRGREIFGRHHKDIEREMSPRANTPDALTNVAVKHAYRIAQQRFGDPGRRFLEAFTLGKDVTEASAYAGFSRKTGHKLLKELRKSPPQKNPA